MRIALASFFFYGMDGNPGRNASAKFLTANFFPNKTFNLYNMVQ